MREIKMIIYILLLYFFHSVNFCVPKVHVLFSLKCLFCKKKIFKENYIVFVCNYLYNRIIIDIYLNDLHALIYR